MQNAIVAIAPTNIEIAFAMVASGFCAWSHAVVVQYFLPRSHHVAAWRQVAYGLIVAASLSASFGVILNITSFYLVIGKDEQGNNIYIPFEDGLFFLFLVLSVFPGAMLLNKVAKHIHWLEHNKLPSK